MTIEKQPTIMELSSQSPLKDLIKKNQIKKVNPLALNNKQLSLIKKELNVFLDTLNTQQSIFTRIALFWGSRPLWQKITAASLLILPPLIIGLIANIAVMIMLSIVTVFTSFAIHFLLENHHNQVLRKSDELKKGINLLTDTLGVIIQSLDANRIRLDSEIDNFEKKNTALASHINTLNKQINALSQNNKKLNDTQTELQKTTIKLQTTELSLKESIDSQSELLQRNQLTLAETIKNHEKYQAELSEQIKILTATESTLKLEVEKAEYISEALNEAVKTLASTVIADGKAREDFQQRLNDFINNKEHRFELLAERIKTTEEQLARVTHELNQSNEKYQQLLEKQEQQINRLEHLDSVPLKKEGTLQKTSSYKEKIGLYALKNQHRTSQNCSQELNDNKHLVV
ncbi:MAG: hypothetical protein PSV35_05525 [bacterium]|nr:hypothetical protein [bacterium]